MTRVKDWTSGLATNNENNNKRIQVATLNTWRHTESDVAGVRGHWGDFS